MADHRKVIRGNKGEVLPGCAREIIFNIIKYFESDKKRANTILRYLNFGCMQRTPEGVLISDELFTTINEFLKEHLKLAGRVVEVTGIDRATLRSIKQEGLLATADGHRICTSGSQPEITTPDTNTISSDEEIKEEFIEMDSELELVSIEDLQKFEMTFRNG